MKIELDLEFFPVRLGRAHVENVADSLMRIDWLEVELHFAFRDAGQIEQVVNELAFQLDVATHHRERAIYFGGRMALAFQSVERGEDGRERRAELVRKHGEEIVLRAIGGFDIAPLLLERGLGPAAFAHPGGKRNGGDRRQDIETLQNQEGLILIRPNEWSKAVQRSPNRDRGKREHAGGRLARRETERSPGDDRTENESNWIVQGADVEPAAEDDFAQDREKDE